MAEDVSNSVLYGICTMVPVDSGCVGCADTYRNSVHSEKSEICSDSDVEKGRLRQSVWQGVFLRPSHVRTTTLATSLDWLTAGTHTHFSVSDNYVEEDVGKENLLLPQCGFE